MERQELANLVSIGITMGCPVGVGPEIIIKFSTAYHGPITPVVIGDRDVLRYTAQLLGMELDILPWEPGMSHRPGTILVHQPPCPPEGGLSAGDDLAWGHPTRLTGQIMAACIEEAVRLVRAGDLAAMVTCPITKAALHKAGYRYPGHTEMLADLCHAKEYAMMMAGRSLRVTLVTIHQGLASVVQTLSTESILRLIDLTGRSLQIDFGLPQPRMAVAGFNPHAGEGGLFGDEEGRIIAPAVAAAQAKGWQVAGPFPPDTIFYKAVSGQYDAVICMYHDQGLIPFKLLHFEDGVNVTIGLPIVRTSVDHGTAYDIAGQGKASPASLCAAFDLAGEIVENRQQRGGGVIVDVEGIRKGRLIAFEGIDGTGKSTQIALLADWLQQKGHDVVVTREPTNGVHGQRIRLLYQDRESVTHQEELDLFLADRREHVAQLIAPALAEGKVILTDRYYFSTAAYQSIHGFDPQEIVRLNETFAPVPDLVFLITIPPEEAMMRIERYRNETLNQFEQEEGLRQAAKVFAGLTAGCIRRVDGSGTINAVHEQVIAQVMDSGILF